MNGFLFTFTGKIGVGKTATNELFRRAREDNEDVLVSTSFTFDKKKLELATQVSALLDDLVEDALESSSSAIRA